MVKREKKSCLFKEHKTCMQANAMCNACFQLYMYGKTNVHRYDLKTTGVCFDLYPGTKGNWIPYDGTAVFWDNRLLNMSDEDAAIYSNEVDPNLYPTAYPTDADATASTANDRTKRNRYPTDHFVAEPSNKAKMNCCLQISLSRKRAKQRAHQETNKENESLTASLSSSLSSSSVPTLLSALAALVSISTTTSASTTSSTASIDVLLNKLPVKVRIDLFSKLVDNLSGSVDGRTGIARKFREIAGKGGPMTLSTDGTSDSAKSLSRKTMRETLEGLTLTINPSNPQKAASRMKGLKTP